jgi:hypothetical protein
MVAGMQSGSVRITISVPGFKKAQLELEHQTSKAARMGTTLEVGAVSEAVTVTDGTSLSGERVQEMAQRAQAAQLNVNSQNVFNLQRRVAGLLPVAVEVPRSGKSYRFVRPLVLEEETRITFQYKSK